MGKNNHIGNLVAQNPDIGNSVAQNPDIGNSVAQNPDNGNLVAHYPENVIPDDKNTGFFNNTKWATTRVAPTTGKTIGEIIGAFQSIVTVKYILGVKKNGWEKFNGKLWQRNYYEHIIRDDKSFQRISDYIENNVKNWQKYKFYIH